MIAGVSVKMGISKMQTTSRVFRFVTWCSLAVGYIGFGTACSYQPQGYSLTNGDGNVSLFRKFGDKTTPRCFSRKAETSITKKRKSEIPHPEHKSGADGCSSLLADLNWIRVGDPF